MPSLSVPDHEDQTEPGAAVAVSVTCLPGEYWFVGQPPELVGVWMIEPLPVPTLRVSVTQLSAGSRSISPATSCAMSSASTVVTPPSPSVSAFAAQPRPAIIPATDWAISCASTMLTAPSQLTSPRRLTPAPCMYGLSLARPAWPPPETAALPKATVATSNVASSSGTARFMRTTVIMPPYS